MKQYLKKNGKVIKQLIDDRLFNIGSGGFSIMIQELDEDGSVNKRVMFNMPRDDGKLQRYL